MKAIRKLAARDLLSSAVVAASAAGLVVAVVCSRVADGRGLWYVLVVSPAATAAAIPFVFTALRVRDRSNRPQTAAAIVGVLLLAAFYEFWAIWLPFLIAAFGTRWLVRVDARSRSKMSLVLGMLVASYAATWMVGTTAIQSHYEAEVHARYSTAAERGLSGLHLPNRGSTSWVFVPLPGIVIAQQGYAVAHLSAADGVSVYVWYVAGVYQLSRIDHIRT